ncbi:MAG: formate dehydrogenase accessory sulfurtransferase FdhD [Candidatus Hydromicrobium sp.]|nr:formate dehydrogenase accessory sulfurtransferase FdhD [Candidatus Hydromicrobium sp.]
MEDKISKLGKKIKIEKIKASSGKADLIDIIPFELLLTISLNGNAISTISCSPANLIELTVGYLTNNGYIESYSDIELLKICSQDIGKIISRNDLASKIEVSAAIDKDKIKHSDSLRFISLECGSIDDFIFEKGLKKIKSNLRIASDIILSLNMETVSKQRYKKEFGGLHSAALFNKNGNLLNLAEDIGRHNCIDKIAGFMLIKRLSPEDKIIFTTGRLGIDVIYKICRMQIPIIVTNSSITFSAAVLAKKINLTVIGYARGSRFNIYSWPRRILK